jgi:hypothetical protein
MPEEDKKKKKRPTTGLGTTLGLAGALGLAIDDKIKSVQTGVENIKQGIGKFNVVPAQANDNGAPIQLTKSARQQAQRGTESTLGDVGQQVAAGSNNAPAEFQTETQPDATPVARLGGDPSLQKTQPGVDFTPLYRGGTFGEEGFAAPEPEQPTRLSDTPGGTFSVVEGPSTEDFLEQVAQIRALREPEAGRGFQAPQADPKIQQRIAELSKQQQQVLGEQVRAPNGQLFTPRSARLRAEALGEQIKQLAGTQSEILRGQVTPSQRFEAQTQRGIARQREDTARQLAQAKNSTERLKILQQRKATSQRQALGEQRLALDTERAQFDVLSDANELAAELQKSRGQETFKSRELQRKALDNLLKLRSDGVDIKQYLDAYKGLLSPEQIAVFETEPTIE